MPPPRGSIDSEITGHLISWRDGDRGGFDRLFPLVYDQLRILARRQLRRSGGGKPLTTTTLIHEAYLKLVDQTRVEVRDRHHFFALAATVMRHIMVDEVRRRGAEKRGGGAEALPLEEGALATVDGGDELVAVDRALERLEAADPRLGKIVELRFFGGLSVEETAEVMDLSPRTVKRDWQKARAFLYHELARMGAT